MRKTFDFEYNPALEDNEGIQYAIKSLVDLTTHCSDKVKCATVGTKEFIHWNGLANSTYRIVETMLTVYENTLRKQGIVADVNYFSGEITYKPAPKYKKYYNIPVHLYQYNYLACMAHDFHPNCRNGIVVFDDYAARDAYIEKWPSNLDDMHIVRINNPEYGAPKYEVLKCTLAPLDECRFTIPDCIDDDMEEPIVISHLITAIPASTESDTSAQNDGVRSLNIFTGITAVGKRMLGWFGK